MFYGFIFGQIYKNNSTALFKHELDGGSKELWNMQKKEDILLI